jgi:S-adenosylmethionine synthetase
MTDTKAPLLDDSAMAEGDPNQVADMYADRLMDEIFGGG